MLTLKKCCEILGKIAPQTDAELEALREHLYAFARVAVEILPTKKSI